MIRLQVTWQAAFMRGLVTLVLLSVVRAVYAEETPHITFVNEYVRELVALGDIQQTADAENKESTTVISKMALSIRNSTRAILALSTNIQVLKGMNLNPPFDTLIPSLTTIYEQKIALEKELKSIAAAFIVGSPLPGVDYPKLAARAPEITAEMDNLDTTLFQSAPLVFGLLIDRRPDREGHASHLITTKSERRNLVHRINVAFGPRLDQKNPNYVVGAAATLRFGLLQSYKSADDAW